MTEGKKTAELTNNELIAKFIGANLDRATSINGKNLWSLNGLPEFCKQIEIPKNDYR